MSQARSFALLTITLAQSICTHYSCFENQGRFVTLKKTGHPAFWKKQGAKNQGHCYSKREEAAWSLLFLNNNDPGFLHPAFWKKQGAWFFSGSQTDPGFQNKNSGCRLTGRLCSILIFMHLEFQKKNWIFFQIFWPSHNRQSICTHYSCFENQGRFVTLKKNRAPCFFQ